MQLASIIELHTCRPAAVDALPLTTVPLKCHHLFTPSANNTHSASQTLQAVTKV